MREVGKTNVRTRLKESSIVSKSLITAPSPQTFIEACDSVRDLEARWKNTLGDIRQLGKELIVIRWWQGKVANVALGMDRSNHYGEEVVKTIAQRAGVDQRTLYRALQFYRQVPGGETALRRWMDDKEEEKGRAINWTYCINWTQKALPEDEKDAEEKLENEVKKLEKKAEKIEQEAADLEEEVISWNGNGMQAEALGTVAKAREVAEDVRHQAERLALEKPQRVEDPRYLTYVKSFRCLACSETNVDPHHLIKGGMGTKGPDYATVPLCRPHHDEIEKMNNGPFALKYDIDLWRAVANLVTAYYSGCRIDG